MVVKAPGTLKILTLVTVVGDGFNVETVVYVFVDAGTLVLS